MADADDDALPVLEEPVELHYSSVRVLEPIRHNAEPCACHATEEEALEFVRWWNFHADMRAQRKGGKWWRD